MRQKCEQVYFVENNVSKTLLDLKLWKLLRGRFNTVISQLLSVNGRVLTQQCFNDAPENIQTQDADLF